MRYFIPFLFTGILSLMLFYTTNAQIRPAIQWQKCLGGTGDDRGHDVLINPDGTLVVVGQTFSNDGNVSGNHGNGDAWVVKLDSTGNIIWQRSLGGTGLDYFKSIIATNDHQYLCIGYTASNNGDVSVIHGNGDAWVVKLSTDGNIISSKCYGGSQGEHAMKGMNTSDGNYAIIGSSSSTDGDLAGVGNGAWVFKINDSGNVLWSKGLNASAGKSGYDIMLSEDNNIYALAADYYTYVITAGVPPENYTMTATPAKFFKLDNTTGNSTLIATLGSDSAYAMCRANNSVKVGYLTESYFYLEYCWDEDFYVASKPDGSSSFSSQEIGGQFTRGCTNAYNDGQYTAPSHGLAAAETSSGVIAAGTYFDHYYYKTRAWLSDLTGFSGDYGGGGFNNEQTIFRSVKVYPNGNDYVVVGYTNDNDGDISGNHGSNDCWVLKLSGLNRIVGNIFIDANNNNIKDAGESPYTHASVKTTSSGFQKTSFAYNGRFDNTVALGNFTSTISLNRPYYTVVPLSKNTTFNSYKNIDSFNFAVHPMPGIIDYAVGVSPLTIPRPGTIQEYSIRYSNKGTTTLTNKDVIFIKDPSLHYVSSTPPYSSVSGDSIKWNISSLAPDAAGGISLNLQLDPIPLVNLGDTIESAVYIDSTLDIYRADNYIPLRQQLSGGFDPNDKQEVHGGFITPAEIAAGKWLDYTIRFQNTGNDTAFTIIIRDTISSKLQADSIEIIGTSHNCNFTVKSGQFITCTFSNIKLVDSLHNEPLSHGYLSYRIKPKSTLVLGDSIRNSASIYFDFNPPVITNTQITVVSNRPLPVVWTGAVSTAWEDPLNWSSAAVPDGNSNVTINTGVPNYPVVNSNAVCRSLKIQPGATFLVKTGFKLQVLH